MSFAMSGLNPVDGYFNGLLKYSLNMKCVVFVVWVMTLQRLRRQNW
jgi:hypothetical protein